MCVCGANFTSEHALQCANGGFIHKRHNKIRDAVAKMLNEVAHDVKVEPPLEPLTGGLFAIKLRKSQRSMVLNILIHPLNIFFHFLAQ